MTQIISSLLPIGMMVLMLSLGLRLAPAEFGAALRAPRALLTGLAVQLIGLPLMAFGLGHMAGLALPLMVGLMLVAASPGGVTSNYAAMMARGSVGLSVSMTLVTSLAAPITLPLVLALSGIAGPGAGGLWKISLGMSAVALVPLLLGMAAARLLPGAAAVVSRGLDPLARLIFLAMVLATFAQNWGAMSAAFAGVGATVSAFALAALALAFGAARAMRLGAAETRTIMIEASMQNVAITIFVASTLMADPGLAIPGLIYAVLMNIAALAVIGWAMFGPGAGGKRAERAA